MKVNVTKIDAARSQLIEAIKLFFEDRDPVSIHTLVGASLQILNDHITDIGEVYDNNLIFHYKTIYIKDEFRKLWNSKMNESKNFFKHADKDLKGGKLSIEFETTLNEFNIIEAIRCLRIVERDDFIYSIELKIFTSWFLLKYPQLLKQEVHDVPVELPYKENFPVANLKEWNEMMHQVKLIKV